MSLRDVRAALSLLSMLPLMLLASHAVAQEPDQRPAPTVAQQQVVPSPVATDTKPLPPVADLLTAVEKHEDRDDAALKQYTYHVHSVTEDFDGSDAVKKTTTEDAESVAVDGIRVHRVTARNGKPLSADEAAKEKERVDKAIESGRKNKAKRDEKAADGKPDDSIISASRMLQLGTFSNERRVELNGRSTIVLDYAGNRNAKTHNAGEKIVEDLVGTVWIDEEDKEIARAEGRFNADFKLGFGLLVDIHKGLSFTLEKQKVNDEVWLTKHVEGQGKASVGVFIVRVHGRSTADMSDYKKFQTGAKIIPGSQIIGADGVGRPQDATPEPAPQPPPR